jgi:hypothetical protein
MNVFALEGATLVFATAFDFIGTPGADITAAGRVTDAAFGTACLVSAADAAPERVSGTALVVAEAPGAAGVPAGDVAGDTDAVIE